MERATDLYAIGIGSNRPTRLGRPAAVVAAAIARLDADYGLFDASPIVLNPATGGAGRDFANAVVLVETATPPGALLGELKAIERAFGRRSGRRWGPRPLDLDILAWSGGQVRSRALTVPHPHLARRTFAVGLLAVLSPHWRVDGAITARHLANRLASRRPTR